MTLPANGRERMKARTEAHYGVRNEPLSTWNVAAHNAADFTLTRSYLAPSAVPCCTLTLCVSPLSHHQHFPLTLIR